jgi:hypothetical protein
LAKLIPRNCGDFETLIKDGYVYVDKTKFIEAFEHDPARYVSMYRPRRFGKTLFLSSLRRYYSYGNDETTNDLFKDTYIGRNPTPKKTRTMYCILIFQL